MAVRHDVSATATATNASSISVSIAVANNPNRLLAATLFQWDPTATAVPTSVTFNISETLDNEANQTFDLARLTINALTSPSATTANVSATVSGTIDRLILHVSSFFGVDQISPLGSSASRSGVTNTVADLGVSGGDTDGGIVYCAAAQDLDSSGSPSVAPKNGMPYFVASGSLSTATSQTSRTPGLPSSLQPGDLVIAHCASESNATHSCATSGWNKLTQQNSDLSWTVSVFWAIQTEAGLSAPVITWTGAADASARTVAFRDTKADGTPCALIGTFGADIVVTHTSTGGNTTKDDVTVVYIDHANANTALGAPAGWTEHTDSGSATGPVRTTHGSKQVALKGTASGDISVVGAAAAWVQYQIELYPADNGNQVQLTETDNLSGFSSLATAFEYADTTNTFGWDLAPNSGKDWAVAGIPINAAPHSFVPRQQPEPIKVLMMR